MATGDSSQPLAFVQGLTTNNSVDTTCSLTLWDVLLSSVERIPVMLNSQGEPVESQPKFHDTRLNVVRSFITEILATLPFLSAALPSQTGAWYCSIPGMDEGMYFMKAYDTCSNPA